MAIVRVNGSSRHGLRVRGDKENGKEHSEETHWRGCRMESQMDVWLDLFTLVVGCAAAAELVEELYDVEMTHL